MISNTIRLRCFTPAEATIVRIARAVRPCLPMTLPRSSPGDLQLVDRGLLVLDLGDDDFIRTIDQRSGDQFQ